MRRTIKRERSCRGRRRGRPGWLLIAASPRELYASKSSCQHFWMAPSTQKSDCAGGVGRASAAANDYYGRPGMALRSAPPRLRFDPMWTHTRRQMLAPWMEFSEEPRATEWT